MGSQSDLATGMLVAAGVGLGVGLVVWQAYPPGTTAPAPEAQPPAAGPPAPLAPPTPPTPVEPPPPPPPLPPEPPPATSTASISSVIRSSASALRRCFEEALRRHDPGIGGRVDALFTITREGRVKSVRLENDSLRAPRASACIRRVLAALRFPAHGDKDDVQVRYPLVLRAR